MEPDNYRKVSTIFHHSQCDGKGTVITIEVHDGTRKNRHLCDSCVNQTRVLGDTPGKDLGLCSEVMYPGDSWVIDRRVTACSKYRLSMPEGSTYATGFAGWRIHTYGNGEIVFCPPNHDPDEIYRKKYGKEPNQ